MMRLLRWVLELFSWLRGGREPSPGPAPSPRKTIVTLLIFPTAPDDMAFDEITQVGDDAYYTSSPWEPSSERVNQAIGAAEDWLAEALGTRIPWDPPLMIDSRRSLSEWRPGKIYLVKDEVEQLGLPWTDGHVYLAFVRGMGGYAGGIGYQDGNAGYAMVGDICLEAICDYPEPTSGSVLLGEHGWPSSSYSRVGQTGAFIHEALHGLGLPHPDGWPEGDQPGWDETLMGNWWLMPNFASTKGLTQWEVRRVLEGTSPSG